MRYIQKLLTKRRTVVCTNCGFLGWQHVDPDEHRLGEFSLKDRSDLQAWASDGAQPPDSVLLQLPLVRCLAVQWNFPHHPLSQEAYVCFETLEVIGQPRQCPYFFKYQPGYSPEEHKELKRDADTRRTLVKASLIGAAIGAAAAIIAQFLYIYLTTPP